MVSLLEGGARPVSLHQGVRCEPAPGATVFVVSRGESVHGVREHLGTGGWRVLIKPRLERRLQWVLVLLSLLLLLVLQLDQSTLTDPGLLL
ncbi:uncharacterized [Tachysurus ichikawai]